jgi:hypothetical protein
MTYVTIRQTGGSFKATDAHIKLPHQILRAPSLEKSLYL